MLEHIYNSGLSMAHYIYHNQNRYISGEEKPLLSTSQTGRNWARANINSGRHTSDLLEMSFFVDIVKNYFNSFLNPQDNIVAGSVVKLLNAVSGFFDGTRDKVMYEEVYSKGLDEVNREELSNEQIANQSEYLGEDLFRDDYLENKLLEVHYKEKLIPKFWNWATKMAGIKPIVSVASSFLGDGLRTAVDTVLETPGRGLWRLRFFPGALHGNFVTAVWDLTRLKVMSLFGSKNARAAFSKKVEEVGQMSKRYFEKKYGDDCKLAKDKPTLRVYFRMLKDRMKEHWDSIWDPKQALQRKLEDKFLTPTSKTERDKNRNRGIDRGFVSIDSSGKVDSQFDIDHQRMLSMSDFTGPICAGLGLVGSFVFEPLRVIWLLAGINAGKNIINALSASRKSFSLVNYTFRFIMEEITQGKKYLTFENAVNPKPGQSEPKKAIKEMYSAMKGRYLNGLMGLGVVVGNVIEPVLHLMKPIFEENRFANFLFDICIKFNDNGLVRLFSKRREYRGRIEDINSLVKQRIPYSRQISIDDYSLISDVEFDDHIQSRTSEPRKLGLEFASSFLTRITNAYDRVVKVFTGELEGIDVVDLKAA